ncbi:acyltransferase [Isobaculum melis]|uniref:Surface polysaccharide O-acyltransferase, integral membrane enzyme n=1 Tax=Isobaculum melis TaxID=142588 RepID=A0A1H9S237_9LACT|nr:acyltransferase [Isobaculum melis]SER79090.1 Surface polysaccharide O-acyltransferase, integral membrane enzyme [Isobaculum melis]
MKKRQSNLEVLRIISMLLIILHHYSVHGNWDFQTANGFQKIFIETAAIGGKIGVNVFVLISGYFLVSSKFNLKKVVMLISQIFFYSCSILLFFKFVLHYPFSIQAIATSLLPTTFNVYWFATTYVALYLLFPYLNIFIKNISQQGLKHLLILSFILLSLVPGMKHLVSGMLFLNAIVWFIFLYLIAAYIRLYGQTFRCQMKHYIWGLLLSLGFIILSFPGIDYIKAHVPLLGYLNTIYFTEMNTVPVLIISVCLFLIFNQLDLGVRPWINLIAKTTFGIYLIHDNVLVRPFLWQQLAKNAIFLHSKWLFLHMIVSVCIVFIFCCIIELIRMYCIEPIYAKLVDQVMETKPIQRLIKSYEVK